MWQEYVDSSNIEWIGYESADRELFVGFLDGSVYVYFDVSESLAVDFVNADSVGRFHHRCIRGIYRYDRIG